MGLSGWHPGERSILKRVGYDEVSAMSYTWIDDSMDEYQRQFHSRNVPFVPLTTLDDQGRPWGSLVAGPSGKPGFISSSNETTLTMKLHLWNGDPIIDNLDTAKSQQKNKPLVAGLGIEFPTRMRLKFAGFISSTKEENELDRTLKLTVNESIGNCPKYINIRDLIAHPRTRPDIIYKKLQLEREERLPQELVDFILRSDTVFFGTSYEAKERDARRFPSHVGMNHRGGRPGFIRVRPADGRTLVLPDYSGNRLLTSLGNVEASGLASMTFLDFLTGDILYLTGTARNLVGEEAQRLMPRQIVLTTLHVEGFIFVRDALPVRQRPGTAVRCSPYSPPIKYLAEEKGNSDVSLGDIKVQLTSMTPLTDNLATFSFETSKPVRILPGQSAVLNFGELLGKQEYAHMTPRGFESRINDDRIRTWTVSSSHTGDDETIALPTSAFEITMREKKGGLVTGALFSVLRHARQKMPEVLENSRPLGLTVNLVGISGEFTLPKRWPNEEKVNLLWIAGGIGITPFLSMLSAISKSSSADRYNIDFVLSTHEPDTMLSLIKEAAESGESAPSVTIKIYSHRPPSRKVEMPAGVNVEYRKGRFNGAALQGVSADSHNAYVCGPQSFEDVVIKSLVEKGYNAKDIVKEGFAY